jgi:L-amino acid N-acyltransferase YncA
MVGLADIIMPNLSFREANISDTSSIVAIHNSNVRTNLESLDRGFLIAKITENSVIECLKQSTRYFVSTEPHNKIVGFVCVSRPKISTEILKKIQWENKSYQQKVQDSRHLFIQGVATQREWSGQGVAQFMYRSLYQIFPSSFLSLFIAINPIYNQRSMNFHLKQGFQKIGTLKDDIFLDLKNYEDALMFKEV